MDQHHNTVYLLLTHTRSHTRGCHIALVLALRPPSLYLSFSLELLGEGEDGMFRGRGLSSMLLPFSSMPSLLLFLYSVPFDVVVGRLILAELRVLTTFAPPSLPASFVLVALVSRGCQCQRSYAAALPGPAVERERFLLTRTSLVLGIRVLALPPQPPVPPLSGREAMGDHTIFRAHLPRRPHRYRTLLDLDPPQMHFA